MRQIQTAARVTRLCALLLAPLGGCPAGVVATGEIDFACSADSACAPGFVCLDGRCQPTGSHTVGDAAALDVGTRDRSEPDRAAIDIGGLDRAPGESGPVDVTGGDRAADGGAADAPAADAPVLDSGAPDAVPGDQPVADSAGADGGVDGGPAHDAAVTCPADWWDCAWSDRLKLTFDNSQQGEDLVDFPVLVHLTRSRVDLDRVAAGGVDLRFVDPAGQQLLPHEIERWTAGQDGWIWVQVPRIDASSTTDHIWMYFDNPGATTAEDPAAVWSAGYRAVWHLNGSATSSIALPGPISSSLWRSSSSEGFIGRGLGLDGVDDRALLASSGALLGSLADLTLSAWVRRDEVANGWRGIVSVRAGDEDDFGSGNFVFHGNADSFGLENNQPFPSTWRAELTTPRQWHLLSVVVDTTADLGLLYLDGREILRYENAVTPTWADQDELRIGARWHHLAEQDYLDGAIDEVRISHVARSAAWQRAQYLAQSDALIRYGEEPWLHAGHGHRVRLRFASAGLEENLIDFPLLVRLDGSVLDLGQVQDHGADLRFRDADGSVLEHQIDVWDATATSSVWVRVPQVNAYSVTDHIWLYYDNPVATDGEDPPGVWSDAYLGVWHLGDGLDSTVHLNHGTAHGTDHGDGLIGDALDVDDDGDGERLEIADSASLDLIEDELTASLWIYRQNSQTDWACGMAREMDIGGLNIFWLGFTGNEHMFITSRNGAEQRLATTGSPPPVGRWFQTAGTYNGRKMRIFVDGHEVAAIDRVGALPPDDNPLSLGGDTNNHGSTWGEQPEALLDEARLQRVARSPAWLRAEHDAMRDALIVADAPQPR